MLISTPEPEWKTIQLMAVDAFLIKFDSSGNFLWADTWGGQFNDEGDAVAVDSSESAYVTGMFMSTVDFDPGSGVDDHISIGAGDAFLSKLPKDGNW